MDFYLTPEHIAFRKMAAEFAEKQLQPYAAEWDEKKIFPVDVLRAGAKLGLAGVVVRPDIGGAGLTRLDAALLFETLATGCVATSAYLSIHNMVTWIVDTYASEPIRTTWGKRLTSMDMLGSYCLTEPNSGSDAASLQTKAVKDGGDYIVNGTKAFISGATASDVYLCMVRTGDNSHHGISCLLIEKNTKGLHFGKLEEKMGWRSQPTTMVFFEDCRVPASHLIGEEGGGFKIALEALNGGRVNIAACALGGAKACLRATQSHLHTRSQFGKTLSHMQALRFYFADMLTDFEAAKLMVYQAASALDKKDEHAPMLCAMAKRFATDVAFRISDKAMQIHGGYGYLKEYPIERIFRDLRVHQILEGTNEIMREIIAKSTLDNTYEIV